MRHKYFYYKLNDELIVNTKNNIEFRMDSSFEYLLDQFCFNANYDPKLDGYYILYTDENGKRKRLHRLLTNCPPNLTVDHISGNTLDNTLKNLRHATKKQQMRNQGMRSNNTSGVKGVNFDRFNNRWKSSWSDDETGKRKTKSFSTHIYPNAKELAIEHRKQKEIELNITHH